MAKHHPSQDEDGALAALANQLDELRRDHQRLTAVRTDITAIRGDLAAFNDALNDLTDTVRRRTPATPGGDQAAKTMAGGAVGSNSSDGRPTLQVPETDDVPEWMAVATRPWPWPGSTTSPSGSPGLGPLPTRRPAQVLALAPARGRRAADLPPPVGSRDRPGRRHRRPDQLARPLAPRHRPAPGRSHVRLRAGPGLPHQRDHEALAVRPRPARRPRRLVVPACSDPNLDLESAPGLTHEPVHPDRVPAPSPCPEAVGDEHQ